MSNKTNNERIAINTVFLAVRMVIVLFITLYTTRVLLASLGIVDYGVYQVVAGFVSMCAFISTSLANGIQRFYNYEASRNGIQGGCKVFNAGIRIQLLLAFLLIVFIELVGLWYINHKMVIPVERLIAAKWVFHAAVISLSLTVLSVPFNAAIMAHEKMHYFALLGVIDAVLKLIIAVMIKFLQSDRLIVYAYLLCGIAIINLLLNLVYARVHFDEIRLSSSVDKELLKSILSFSGWNAFGTFARSMRSQGVGMVLNLFFGPVVNAAQGVASQVKGGLHSMVANLTTASRPQIVQSYARGDHDRTIKLMFSISKLVLFVLLVFILPIYLELPMFLRLWLGDNIPEHTLVFVRLVLVTMFVTDLHLVTSTVVHATGKMRTYQLVCSTLNILIIPLVYVALRLGAGAEIAFWFGLLIELLVQIASLLILRSLVSFSLSNYFKYCLWPFVKVLCVSFPLSLIPFLLMKSGMPRLFVVSLSSICLTSVCVYMIGLNAMEKGIVHSFVAKLLRKKVK